MISICLPLYNFDARPLVWALQAQIIKQKLPINILLIDDASQAQYQNLWPDLCNAFTHLLQLPKNIGRSQIRNLFAQQSQAQDYLLFLDGDSGILADDFLSNYLLAIQQNPETKVFYGGRMVAEICPSAAQMLKWKYGQQAEYKAVEARQKAPYLHFQSNNFLIEKACFKANLFNPNFTTYGYEDVDFAINLQKNKIALQHVHNPILNQDIETAELFLQKIEKSMASLALLQSQQSSELLYQNIKLLDFYRQIKTYRLSFGFKILAFLGQKRLRNYLIHSQNPSLKALNLYKLFLLLRSS
jgi:Glycosyl transferase family 2